MVRDKRNHQYRILGEEMNTISIDSLWIDIENYTPDVSRTIRFIKAYSEVINKVNEGHVFSGDEVDTDYWDYLKSYHASWREEPISDEAYSQLKKKFFDGINLFHDIKENGMRNPLEIRKKNGKRHLSKGNRRLVILKILGIPQARVNVIDE